MKNIRKTTFLAIAAAVLAFGAAVAAPALAGNTLFDDSTTEWLNGSASNAPIAEAGQPCDPATVKGGGLSFLP